jgi:uncharacterized membrane protein HdeD (DUF308 family)
MADGKSNWIWRLLGGIILIILGIAILVYPDVTLAIVVLIVGIFLIIEGLFELVFGFTTEAKAKGARWIFLLKGVIDLILGAIILVYPDITLTILVYLVAAWAIIWGIFELVATFMVPKEVQKSVYGTGGRWVGVLIGLIAIVFGIVLAVYPGATLTIIIWLVGFLVIIVGIMMAINSFGTRKTKA